MKKSLIPALFIALCTISCGKDDPAPPPAGSSNYMNTTAGAQWRYQITDSSTLPPTIVMDTLTSTNRDTTLGGKQYHIFTSSTGGFEFHGKTGNDYYSFFSIPDPVNIETPYLYLKADAPVNTTWEAASADVTIPGVPGTFTVKVNNTIVAKGLTKTVNARSYTNVIQVSSVITIVGVPGITSSIHTFYAPDHGQIEGIAKVTSTLAPIDINTHTKLMSSSF